MNAQDIFEERMRKIKEIPSNRQLKFYKDCLDFLKKNEIETVIFERPRNKREMSSFINGMITTMKKHGLFEEFYYKK